MGLWCLPLCFSMIVTFVMLNIRGPTYLGLCSAAELGNLGAKACRMVCFALTILVAFIKALPLVLALVVYDCDRRAAFQSSQSWVVVLGGRIESEEEGRCGAFRFGGMPLSTAEWYLGACLKLPYDCDFMSGPDYTRVCFTDVGMGVTRYLDPNPYNGAFSMHINTAVSYGIAWERGACLRLHMIVTESLILGGMNSGWYPLVVALKTRMWGSPVLFG